VITTKNLSIFLNISETKSSNSNPETILALLQTSSAECEEESDKISSEFLDNNLTVEEFMEKFMTSRKLMHLRKLKSEKMSELLQSQRTGQRPGPGGFYQHQQQQSSSSVPYPINPTMPMPGFKY
jgi:ESCRT-I complex subunit VPS37